MQEKMIIFTDGGSRGNPGIAGAGIFITDEKGNEIYQEHKFLGQKTNNEAEYMALEIALEYLKKTLKTPVNLTFNLDSKLVVEQLNRNWKIKEARLMEIAKRIWKLLSELPCSTCEIKHVPRAENKIADLLANQAMDSADI